MDEYWQIAVFCRNEQHRIRDCLKSISDAVGARPALITVIVNGSTDGSEGAAHIAGRSIETPVEMFRIEHPDKSNAINTFFYNQQMRQKASLYFFVDGYVTIGQEALSAIADALRDNPFPVAASGIASNGRTMSQDSQLQRQAGALRGALYALRPEFLDRIVESGIRLPIGLYRGDGLLNSMAAHDLDPLEQAWNSRKILTVPAATFAIDSLSAFRLGDWRRQFRRRVNQMRGKLENEAIKNIIYARGYRGLPRFADDLIRDYLTARPIPTVPLPDLPFMAIALHQHRNAKRPHPPALEPARIRWTGFPNHGAAVKWTPLDR